MRSSKGSLCEREGRVKGAALPARGGGGHSGTKWLPTAKRPRREAHYFKIGPGLPAVKGCGRGDTASLKIATH